MAKTSGDVDTCLTQAFGEPTGGHLSFDQAMSYETGGTPPKLEDEALPARVAAHRAQAKLDQALLRKARELVSSIVPSDPYETQLFLMALAGTLAEMWESAAASSEWHQDILATLESAVKATVGEGTVNGAQVRFFREALSDLQQDRLVQKHAEVIRAEFVRQGFPSLGFME